MSRNRAGPQANIRRGQLSNPKSSRRALRQSKGGHDPASEYQSMEKYYSGTAANDFQESQVGRPPYNPSYLSPDSASLSRIMRIIVELRQELTQLTARMSLQGQKRFTYHQKLQLLQNQIDRLSKSKDRNLPSLPVVLLDDSNPLQKDREIVILQRRINQLQERIMANELETQREMNLLIEEIRRKDRTIQNFNDKVLAQVAAGKAFQHCIDRIKENLSKYRHQLGGAERLVLERVEFPNVGSFQVRPQVLARQDMKYSRNTWASEYRNHILVLFRELERLHLVSDSIGEETLERIIEGFLMSLEGSQITQVYKNSTLNVRLMKDKFAVASSLLQSNLYRLRNQYPNIENHIDPQLMDIISRENISLKRVEGGVVYLDRVQQVLIQVPIIQQRNIMVAPTNQIDIHLSEEFNMETDRLRNTAFHLRVLIKALLEQLEKVRRRTGFSLEIDERIIAMINQQAGGIIDVEDVLRVFHVQRPQDQIIFQSQPQRIIQVPEVVIVDKIVEKIIQVQRIREVERIVNVPIQVPRVIQNIVEKIVPVQRIVERVVEVPVWREKIVEVIVEIPKIVHIQTIVQKIVQVDKIIEVQRHINHVMPEPQQIQVVVEKVVVLETIVQKILQVPTIIQKIVEKVIRVPQLIEIEIIVEKIVKQIQYVVETQTIPHIQVQHRIVQRIVEKLVPVIQIQERIVEVPQVLEKIIQVRTIQESLVEVELIREKLVFQDRIREIEIVVERVVPLVREVEKIVQVRIQIPMIVQKLVVVQQFVREVVIQRVLETVIQQVILNNPVVIKEPQVIEVQKIINHYIQVPNIVKVYQDRIVEVPVHVERVKEVRVIVQKIIEKMVEVPKVVEIQRIVERIVVVPRIVQKIVEVPQIVEVAVDRVILNEVIREVERIIEVPMVQTEVLQVEVVNNVYIPQERVVEIIVEKIVQVPTYEQKVLVNEVLQEKVIEVIREVPKEIHTQEMVPYFVEREKFIEIQKTVIVPVEMPVLTQVVTEKVVTLYEIREQILQVPQVVERIVEIKVEEVRVHQLVQLTQDIVIETQIVSVPECRVVIEKQFVEVPTVVEKIVPINSIVDNIIQTDRLAQKIVQVTNQVPKVYEVQRLVQKMVAVPQVMEIEVSVPQIIRVNQIVEQMVERIVQVPVLMEVIKEIVTQRQRIVAINNTIQQIVEVQKIVNRPVIVEKFREVVRDINHIHEILKIVDRFQNVLVPVVTCEERIVQVPCILEKIVQRIVIMPQVKQVLKYVHEIVQEDTLGFSVSEDISHRQHQYKMLIGSVRGSANIVVDQLNKLSRANPSLIGHVEMLVTMLNELDKLNKFPRIFPVTVEKVVQKPVQVQKIVRLPVRDQNSVRTQLSLAILADKLLNELVRIRNLDPHLQLQLDDDIRLIFLPQFGMPPNVEVDFQQKLMQFSSSVQTKFQSLGSWSQDHQVMLNSFLQQRFVMANLLKNSNLEMEKTRMISQKRLQGLRRYKMSRSNYEAAVNQLMQLLPQLQAVTQSIPNATQHLSRINIVLNRLSEVERSGGFNYVEPIKTLDQLKVTDQRVLSLLRQKEYEIFTLREKLSALEKRRVTNLQDSNIVLINQLNRQVQILRGENGNMQNKLSLYTVQKPETRIRVLNEEVLQLQQDNADLQNLVFNLRNQLETHLQFSAAEIEQYKIRLSNSGVTTIADISPRNYYSSEFQSPIKTVNSSSNNLANYNVVQSHTYQSGLEQASYPTYTPTYAPIVSTDRPAHLTPDQHLQSSLSAREWRSPEQDIQGSRLTQKSHLMQNGYDNDHSLCVPGVNYEMPPPNYQVTVQGVEGPVSPPEIPPTIQTIIPITKSIGLPGESQFGMTDSLIGGREQEQINHHPVTQTYPRQTQEDLASQVHSTSSLTGLPHQHPIQPPELKSPITWTQSETLIQSDSQPLTTLPQSKGATISSIPLTVRPSPIVTAATSSPIVDTRMSIVHQAQPLQQSQQDIKSSQNKFERSDSLHSSPPLANLPGPAFNDSYHSQGTHPIRSDSSHQESLIKSLASDQMELQQKVESEGDLLHSQSQFEIREMDLPLPSSLEWPQHSPDYQGLQRLSNEQSESSNYSGYSGRREQ